MCQLCSGWIMWFNIKTLQDSAAWHKWTQCYVCEFQVWQHWCYTSRNAWKQLRKTSGFNFFPPRFFPSRVDLEERSLRCLFAAHWTAKGQTRCMLSGGGCSCHGRPGRYQDGISRLCLDDRIPPASPSLLSVHGRPSASVSWQPAQHDNRTTKGDEAPAVSTLNHILGCCYHHMSRLNMKSSFSNSYKY